MEEVWTARSNMDQQEVWTVLKLEELNNQSEPKADKKSQEESSEHVNGKRRKDLKT